MTDERDEEGNLLLDAQRLTNVERFVQLTSNRYIYRYATI
jgi:hypothetical protein